MNHLLRRLTGGDAAPGEGAEVEHRERGEPAARNVRGAGRGGWNDPRRRPGTTAVAGPSGVPPWLRGVDGRDTGQVYG
ncbi:hypothetical protein ACFXP3_39190, partial [Streptomyces sp. NPDC059096]|uniref:hypothetical protein n=1 Tax=Streptomyces sp. NPDC059096 TaxID=3346727 RepID=UPI0036C0926D